MRAVVIIALVIAVASVLGWLVVYPRLTQAANASNASNEPTYVWVTAKDMQRNYSENEVRADNEYKGRVVRVAGTVQSIQSTHVHGRDIPFVTLDSGLPDVPVYAYFNGDVDDVLRARLGALSRGSEITVECTGAGRIVGDLAVDLSKCSVLSGSTAESPAVRDAKYCHPSADKTTVGVCMESSSCPGHTYAGLCQGGAEIMCCVSATP